MTAAVQTIWADVIVGALVAAGVEAVVVSPGSRSTPLALALAREPRVAGAASTGSAARGASSAPSPVGSAAPSSVALEVVIDERAAAFHALGRARATGRPVALICTSGTAAAHYLPAIIEASLADLPLIALTADRPPELQHAGAPQTIDQQKLFGDHVRACLDLGPPGGGALGLRAARRAIAHAVQVACGPRPGPVHVNVPLRKPLEPAAPATPDEHALAALARELSTPLFAPPPRAVAADDAIAAAAAAIAGARRGLIVAGPAPAWRDRAAVWALARATGFPILAEATSQLRFGRPDDVVACDGFELVLAARAADRDLAPDLIVQLGGEPTAGAWAPWLARHAPARWVLASHAWPDPHATAAVVIGDVDDAVARLAAAVAGAGRAGDDVRPADDRPPARVRTSDDRAAWAATWRAADAAARAAVAAALAQPASDEPRAIRAAVAAAPGAQLVLGNSLPIRLVDAVCPGAGPFRPVLSQRGANGIDGLIAGAAGAASATARPTVLILGDVSFAHDVGALITARAARAPLAIVVIDNAGGRIFDALPLAQAGVDAELFARLWTTAPALDPVAVAAALGCRAIRVAEPAALTAAVAAAVERPGATLIHAPVAPASAAAFRQAALAALAAAPRFGTAPVTGDDR